MSASEHEPPPPPPAADDDEGEERVHDEPEGDDAYERAQPGSQPTVSSEPEPDDDPTNAG